MPDDTDILAQWVAVCEAASKEPWTHVEDGEMFVGTAEQVTGPALSIHGRTNLGRDLQPRQDAAFIAAARTGWPATIKALRVLMQFAEHEDLLWGDPENPAAKAITKATAILGGRDAKV